MDNTMTLKILMWGFGICVTGFFFLAMWIRQVSDALILDEIKSIKIALVGDVTKPGMLSILHKHTDEIKYIKSNCEKNHG
jgi:hypothetical protein